MTFEALVLDWDGTVVPDRLADATPARERVEALTRAGIHVLLVTGTHLEIVDNQLGARPQGPGRLFVCCNRGSEVFEVTGAGPTLVSRRTATDEEDAALDRAATRTVEHLTARGLSARVVSQRLNRRKIDLIPVPEWADPKKADIGLLADAVRARLDSVGITGLAEVVALATDVARSAGLADPRITSDVKHVEIGLTDKSDSARFAARWLAELGITGSLVLLGGDEFGPIGGVPGSDSLMMVSDLDRAVVVSVGVEPASVPPGVLHAGGGPPRLLDILDGQLARRVAHRVPQIDHDPAWVLVLDAGTADDRVTATLGSLSNGWAGTRGTREEDVDGSSSEFLVAGAYADDGHLLSGPSWTGMRLAGTRSGEVGHRMVDLHTGLLVRARKDETLLRSMRLVCAASPHVLTLRAEATPNCLEAGDALLPSGDGTKLAREDREEVATARAGPPTGGITVAAHDRTVTSGSLRVVERMAAWTTTPGRASFEDARQQLAEAERTGFDRLLAMHRSRWAQWWAGAEVVIEGNDEDRLAARFAVFHLLGAAADVGDAAVGARGLTGGSYAGHVFWDADVFVLPALAALRPDAARAMLEYRVRRLPEAHAEARARGLRGARFPWESDGDGSDVTPRHVRGRHGELIPIATGSHEEHIVADVAWAASCYATWTGDGDFLAAKGRGLLVDTARYWASRMRLDADGKGHIHGVMGPDESHQIVDDNAYTNVMARWNLRHGADVLDRAKSGTQEAAHWRALADAIVDGWSVERGIYEQFAGYFALEPLLISQVATVPVAIDMVLGPERVAGSQLIKQADVLMLHHLIPDEVVAGSLEPCLAFYEPRTAQGSSLSPAIYASLLARAGQTERALELFRLAARLDLDDRTRTTSEGLHLATMGGTWQALAYGFLGLSAKSGVLSIDPHLPDTWSALGLRFHFQGNAVGVRAEHDRVSVTCDAPLLLRIANRSPQLCQPPGISASFRPPASEESHA